MKNRPTRAAEDVDRHEHDREAGDEQEHADQQAAAGRLGVRDASATAAGRRIAATDRPPARGTADRRAGRGATAPPMNPRYPGTSGSTHGERNDRSPASDRDRDREPERAVGDDRAGVHELLQRVAHEGGQHRGIRQLADDARGHPALAVEHERRRRRVDRRALGERELDRAVLGGDHARVGDAVGLGERGGGLGASIGVDAEERDVLARRTPQYAFSRSAASARHGPHAAYQKFTTSTSPA